MKIRFAPALALASALALFVAVEGIHAAQNPAPPTAKVTPRSSTPDPKEALTRKLMDLSGANNIGKQVCDSMLEQFKQMPNLPEGFAEKFKELARPQMIVEMIVPIYMKNYDVPTLQAVVDFYQSEAGRAFAAKQPMVMAESQRAGQRWSMELAQKVMAEIQHPQPAPQKP